MQEVFLENPAWMTSFPNLVAPLSDEWLPGLLLRSDEANEWMSKTTLAHVLRLGPEKFHRCWRTDTPNLITIQNSSLRLDYLAQLLALSERTLLSTTYHTELERLYGGYIGSWHLNPSFSFHLCPKCIAEQRLLQRVLTLPQIQYCPHHQIALLEKCQCGTRLRLFHRQSQPFTCYAWGLSWANLPCIKISAERAVEEQKILSWYAFFFSQEPGHQFRVLGAVNLYNRVSSRKKEKQTKVLKVRPKRGMRTASEPLSLGTLILLLTQKNISPKELKITFATLYDRQ